MIARLFAPLSTRLNIRSHPAVRKILLPLIVISALFGLLVLLDNRIPTAPFYIPLHVWISMAAALLAGVLLTWLFEKKWFRSNSIGQKNLILTGFVVWGICLFCILSPKVGWHYTEPAYRQMYVPLLLTTLLPWFFWRALIAVADVPQLRYAPFVFKSVKDAIATIDFSENNRTGIRWIFTDDFVEVSDNGIYTMRTFTPNNLKSIPLDDLFMGLIALHNIGERPQQPIFFYREGDDFYGWEFYDYPYWFWRKRKRYLDPYKTVGKLRLRYPVVPESERLRAVVTLLPRFRSATIYITRSI